MEGLFCEEKLDDAYKCEKCKNTSQAKKLTMIGKTPKILVVHFKRFKMFPKKKKIIDFVQYPITNLEIKK